MGPRGFTLFRPPDSVKWCWYLQVVTQPVEDRCLRWSFRRNEWHLLGGYVYKYTIALLITIDDKLVLLKCSNRGRSVQWLCLWISPLRGWAVKQHLQYTTLTAQTVEEPWILTPNYFWPVQSVGKKRRWNRYKCFRQEKKINVQRVRQIYTGCPANSTRSPGGCQKWSRFALNWHQGYAASPKLHLIPRIIFACSSAWACFWL